MSAVQPETFSPKNLVVLGGLLAIALFLGEIVVGPSHDDGMAARVGDTMEDIAMRLKPVVTLDEMKNSTMLASASGAGVSKTPDQLYQGACFACHGTGAAGAPKLGDAAAWTDRLAKGLDALVSSAIGGVGAMPPRGGSALDDDQIRSVVEYMIDNSK